MPILDRFSLKGRIALVTAGAGPLFGSSISEALAEAGATVITASRSLERNEQFAAELRSRGYQAQGLSVDVCQDDSIARLHEQVLARFGAWTCWSTARWPARDMPAASSSRPPSTGGRRPRETSRA